MPKHQIRTGDAEAGQSAGNDDTGFELCEHIWALEKRKSNALAC